ncbi:hypothetical protein EDB83DRAFT_1940933 [Lactarius deliciosus]|nr:hypothetical protein EDB83DRAFT_1940933 [Lactarius deliciosus]
MATFFSEVFLLLAMTIGLLRQRDHYLGRLLFNQCMICLGRGYICRGSAICDFIPRSQWTIKHVLKMFQVACLPAMTICVHAHVQGPKRDNGEGPVRVYSTT